MERVRNRAMDLAPTIKELQAGGCESLRPIAARLEERASPRRVRRQVVQPSRWPDLLEAAAVPFDGASVAVT